MVIPVALPLLIVKDRFRSLSSMTVEELETFIPYLVKCSINIGGARLINGRPEWWVSSIKYHFPLQKPPSLSQLGYHRHLREIVYNCYCHHNAQYMLSFSSKFACHPESVLIRADDKVTSVFFLQEENFVLSFSNENRFYDAPRKDPPKSARRRLLPLVSKPTVLDIYLCDNCDAEFSSHEQMQKHEQECYAIVIDDSDDDDDNNDHDESDNDVGNSCQKEEDDDRGENSEKSMGIADGKDQSGQFEDNDSDSSEEIEVIQHIKPFSLDFVPLKDKLFNYLRLEDTTNRNLTKLKRYACGLTTKRRTNKINGKGLLLKGCVELSTSFGQVLLENYYKHGQDDRKFRDPFWYEEHCRKKPETKRQYKQMPEMRTSYRRGRKKGWSHVYSFGKRQRLERWRTIETGLNSRSRALLKQCKKLSVVLTRLKLPS